MRVDVELPRMQKPRVLACSALRFDPDFFEEMAEMFEKERREPFLRRRSSHFQKHLR